MSAEANRALLTTRIVGAYLNSNEVKPGELPALIINIAAAFGTLGVTEEALETIPRLTRAQIQRSIRPGGLISFEDGKSYRGLRRHLTKLAMTPEVYRAKWGLPTDYPMVCAEYSAARSAFAKSSGLGRKKAPDLEVSKPKPLGTRVKGKLGLFGSNKER
jgi:predicted transcriptional regulator